MYYSYSKPCSSLPYKEAQVKFLTERMKQVGYDDNFPVVIWNGSILDGRHRYNAAELAGLDPSYTTFKGTEQEAWDYVSATNVDGTRHINNEEKQFFYVQRADALGVRTKGENQHTTNAGSPPSAKDHAEALGVNARTVERWESERKEIAADPELSLKASTPDGYKKAKKEVQKRRKATKEESNKIAKLKSLGERSEAESSNVDRKLDKYREQGIDVDEVESQGDADRARDDYREQQRPITEMADAIAKILIDTKDYRFVATLVRAAYPKQGDLEHAYNLITAEGN